MSRMSNLSINLHVPVCHQNFHFSVQVAEGFRIKINVPFIETFIESISNLAWKRKGDKSLPSIGCFEKYNSWQCILLDGNLFLPKLKNHSNSTMQPCPHQIFWKVEKNTLKNTENRYPLCIMWHKWHVPDIWAWCCTIMRCSEVTLVPSLLIGFYWETTSPSYLIFQDNSPFPTTNFQWSRLITANAT